MKNKKIDFLINQFKLTEQESEKIENVCKTVGVEKYIVWVAKEYKKNKDIISDVQNLIFIFDWVKREKVDVLKYDFEGLMSGSQEWHRLNFKTIEKENNRNSIMNDGVIYRCRDKKHFFKLLTPIELEEEGELMGNCIGGEEYKNKLKKKKSILISLRDEKNLPHVDIEIDTKTSESLQVLGKGNQTPAEMYNLLILEYAYYALGLQKEIDKEILDLMYNKR